MEKECEVGSVSAGPYQSILALLPGRIKKLLEPQGFCGARGQNVHSAIDFGKEPGCDLRLFDYRSVIAVWP